MPGGPPAESVEPSAFPELDGPRYDGTTRDQEGFSGPAFRRKGNSRDACADFECASL